MKKCILLLFFSFCCTSWLNAQVSSSKEIEQHLDKIDSLIKNQELLNAHSEMVDLEKKHEKLLKGNAYFHYVKARLLFHHAADLEGSEKEYLQARNLYEKARDHRKVAVINGNLSNVYLDQSNLPKAKEVHKKAMEFYESKPEEQLDYFILLSNYARIFLTEGDYLQAATYYLEVLDYYEKEGTEKQKGRAHAQVGLAYDYANMFKQAEHYYGKAIEYRIAAADTLGLINTYNNMGILNKNQGRSLEAIGYYQHALTLANATQLDQHKINPLINLGVVHRILEKYPEAVIYYEQALQVSQKLQNEGRVYDIYNNLSHLYIVQKNYQKAFEYSKLATTYMEKTQNLEDLVSYSYNHALALNGLGRHKEAFEVLLQRSWNADSLYNLENARNMADMSAKYETSKKEQQIDLLSHESNLQKLKLRQREWALGISILILGLSILTFNLLIRQRKLKVSIQLKEEIQRQQELSTRAVLQAEEQERRRMAADLHDGVGQWLSVALLHLNHLKKELHTQAPTLIDVAMTAIKTVEDSYDEMRSISHQMMPHALLKVGLVSAVKEFVHQLNKHDIVVNLHVHGLKGTLEEQLETTLYRVIQESVNNVVKHAQATRLSIQLQQDTEGITVSVEDNGIGFSKDHREFTSGIGLSNIQSRVNLLNGFLEIDTEPGKGTQITVFIPQVPSPQTH